LTGPCLRGSGVELDLRRHNPYSGYETYDFEIPVEPTAMFGRAFRVRMRELYESYKIIRQALERLKPGPIKADAPKVVLARPRRYAKTYGFADSPFLIVAEGFSISRRRSLSRD
jgi:NADH-quinone oxidoreductase subunit D